MHNGKLKENHLSTRVCLYENLKQISSCNSDGIQTLNHLVCKTKTQLFRHTGKMFQCSFTK